MLTALVAAACLAPMTMSDRIQQYQADLGSIGRFYNIEFSPNRAKRFQEFYAAELHDLDAVDFDHLDQPGKVDYLLFHNLLQRNQKRLALTQKQYLEASALLPYASDVIAFSEARQHMKPVDAPKVAAQMADIRAAIEKKRKDLEGAKTKPDQFTAYRAAKVSDRLDDILDEWFRFYDHYDPQFGWWVSEPYKGTLKAMKDYTSFLREKIAGIPPGDTNPIVGDPIGREALVDELHDEFIPYTPEELIEMGKKEFGWCEIEMKKASRELGYGDDWKKALEHVKTLYVEPGKQPQLIRDLAEEAIKFVEDNDLVTVPELAKETWRMQMMSPERQKVNPFFLGGESIIVSFPTDEMEHQEKLMSLRANNVHFARATVFHELIPGHHLQGYYESRYHTYRDPFGTPFWVEGWALYWEFLLWEKNFAKSPENRIGMLFWRMHRCARIIFSLSFHLKQMTAQQCIDMLVDKVGHERSTAEGEVRRSFGGDYPPLYQLAYMVGAFQFWQLRHELVDSKKMTDKDFHDSILKENNIPVEMLRALIENQKLDRNFQTNWRFYNR
jgi:uncharacterized protein (DUF885 family)